MHAEEFIGDNGSNGQKIESGHKDIVSFNIAVLLIALIIETVILGA